VNRTKLRQAGHLIWGERYVAPMGRALGISLATAQRWDDGRTPTIPDWVEGVLLELLTRKRTDIDKAIAKLKARG
jgi:hypothetical protein